jgi:hypothetical protein
VRIEPEIHEVIDALIQRLEDRFASRAISSGKTNPADWRAELGERPAQEVLLDG